MESLRGDFRSRDPTEPRSGDAGFPLLGLRLASSSGWTAIFARVGLREAKLMFVFALLNIVITMMVGAAIKFFGTATANAGIAEAAQFGGAQLVNFFTKVAVQLLGEELITILPFLAILALAVKLTGMARNASIIVAWLASAVAFGFIHLPTYDWNLIQCLVVIGSARRVLSWRHNTLRRHAWMTKNRLKTPAFAVWTSLAFGCIR